MIHNVLDISVANKPYSKYRDSFERATTNPTYKPIGGHRDISLVTAKSSCFKARNSRFIHARPSQAAQEPSRSDPAPHMSNRSRAQKTTPKVDISARQSLPHSPKSIRSLPSAQSLPSGPLDHVTAPQAAHTVAQSTPLTFAAGYRDWQGFGMRYVPPNDLPFPGPYNRLPCSPAVTYASVQPLYPWPQVDPAAWTALGPQYSQNFQGRMTN